MQQKKPFSPGYSLGQVGQKHPEVVGLPDSVYFDLTDCGAICKILTYEPTYKEQEEIKANHAFEIRTIEQNDILFILLKFGDLPWMDAPYTVHLSKHLTTLPSYFEPGTGFPLIVQLLDTSTGKLMHQRLIGLDHNVSMQIVTTARRQLKQEFNHYLHQCNVYEVMSRYTTDELVTLSQDGYRKEGI